MWTKSLFLALLFSAVIATQFEHCKENSVLPTSSCNRYIICVNGQLRIQNCPPHHSFDRTQKICLPGVSNCRPDKSKGKTKRQTVDDPPNDSLTKFLVDFKNLVDNFGNWDVGSPSTPSVLPLDVGNSNLSWKNFTVSNCGSVLPPVTDNLVKISGGEEITIEMHPWQVAIMRSDNNSHSCGGSVITRYHVLSAAHCFLIKGNGSQRERPKESRYILAGTTYLTDMNAQKFNISQLFVHKAYQFSHHRNDIALIRIQGEFTFDSKMRTIYPICLPPSATKDNYVQGRICEISGWGEKSSESSTHSNILKYAMVRITSDELCKRKNQEKATITRGMFCAGEYETEEERREVEGIRSDTCKGDSGGPIACKEGPTAILYGITSWGIGCGIDERPGVYTNVYKYLPWIKSRIEFTEKIRPSYTEDEDIIDV